MEQKQLAQAVKLIIPSYIVVSTENLESCIKVSVLLSARHYRDVFW